MDIKFSLRNEPKEVVNKPSKLKEVFILEEDVWYTKKKKVKKSMIQVEYRVKVLRGDKINLKEFMVLQVQINEKKQYKL